MVHVVVTHMGNDADLDRTLRSLVRQSWRHWRALVVGDVSGAAAVRRIADDRIEFRAAVPDAVISRANDGLAGVDRDLAMMIESGDLLAPDCVFEIVQVANRDPLVDLVYWDDDLVDHEGHRSDPRFRPSWSPETLLGANYLGSALAIRGRRLALVAGIPDGLHDATTWELVLRCDLEAESVRRIPRVLTHVRRRPQASASASTDVVQRYLDRRQEPATVTLERGTVRTRWEMDAPPHVTVVIPTRHNRAFMGGCLGGLLRTDYPSVDVVVVDNGERTDANEQWYRESFPQLDLQVEWWTEQPFNYSAVNNAGAALARGEVLVFLNDDTEMPDPGWLREMVSWAVRPDIGLVGAQLIGPDGEIQHGGVVLGMHGFADHLFQGMRPDSPVAPRPDVVVPRRARGHRRLCRGAARAVRAARRARRALRALRQRRRARPRLGARGQAQRGHAVRERPAPRIGDARQGRGPGRRLLRQPLALPELGAARATPTSRRACRSTPRSHSCARGSR